jgi:ABC-type multidrug transport system fused ATPase/permease subunit
VASPIPRLLRELRPFRRLQAAAVSLTVAQALFGFVPPVILGDIVNRLQRGEPVDTVRYLVYVVGFALGAGLLSYAANTYTQRLGHSYLLAVRERLYGHMQSLPVGYFDKNKPGKLVSNVLNDPSTVMNLISGNLNTLVSDAVQLSLVLVILFAISWKLALLALIATPVYALDILRTMKPLSETSEEIRSKRDEMFGDMQEKLTGIQVVKGFGKERWEVRSFHSLTRGLFGLNVRQSALGARMWTFADALGGIGQGAVLYFGGLMVLRGEMQAGTLVMFLLYAIGYVYGPVVRFLLVLDPLARSQAALNRIYRTLDTQSTVTSPPDAPPMPPIEGRVRFEEVGFEYVPGVPVLRGVDLTVEPGELIAFVGHSGSGKTTLANLLMRHFDPVSGRIVVDGVDVRTVELDSYRRQVGYVLQDPQLFNTSLLENVRYGRPGASEAEVEAACRAANVHDWALTLPEGYATRIGELGVDVSQGERQGRAIARALLADPRLLILDEATSSLDSQNEALIQEALERLLRGRTSFVIAHRLSTVIRADKIVVMEEGRVSRVGRHEDLLAEPDGLYARMFRQQFAVALEGA